ncbi:hypothetical protein [Glaciihabitans sp. UYNi722]|uniref:hypothetical protein n=1 Tax=Glaciihabitans sp. UYNi722 TaxID=3156344 RepID=UPI0033968973
MQARRTSQTVAANIREAMTTTGTTPEIVSEATHIDLPDLTERLNGTESFDMAELVAVGGFLRIRPETLMKGVAA